MRLKVVCVSEEVQETMPRRYAALAKMHGDTALVSFQEEIRSCLMQDSIWADWIESIPSRIQEEPLYVQAGLDIKRDDEGARKLLVGFARCIQPENVVQPYYALQNLAVTEVLAQPNMFKESHSKNDLPAPPHVAAFFERVLPHTCYFACIRPHPGGGGETTVANLEAVLKQASPELIDAWRTKTYYLRTSERLGNQVLPFRLLTEIERYPFLRYRREYTEHFDEDPTLIALQKRVCNLDNHYKVLLRADEILIHWNGAPHSRLPQIGETPELIHERRKLIRCRTQPVKGWDEHFAYS